MRNYRHIRLVEEIRLKGRAAYQMAPLIGVSGSQFYHWLRKPEAIPLRFIPLIEGAAKAWGIECDGLFEWVEKGAPPNTAGSQVEAEAELTEHTEEHMQTTREYPHPEELAFFQLTGDPFDDLADPQRVWLGPQQQYVERSIINAVRGHNILALVGEVGSGKSTILRRFLARWHKDRRIRVISPDSLRRQSVDEGALAVAICRDLEPGVKVPHSAEGRSHKVRLLLERCRDEGVHPVLVIEEAHDLSPDALIGLKRIWDSYSLFRQLGIIMVGQGRPRVGTLDEADLRWDLGSRLRFDHRIRELGQRTRVVHLHPYDADQVEQYLAWRFKSAGADVASVFEPSAFQALAGPQGYPLTISNVAVLAMRKACDLGDSTVTADHVQAVTS